MAVKKAKKKPSVAKLKKKLDTIFSQYIRYRHAFPVGGDMHCQCVTCGKTAAVKNMQAGHFMSRRYNATRFHEQNVHVQCVGCNMFDQGRQYDHAIYIDDVYGKGTSAELREKANELKQYKVFEVEELIEHYKQEVKSLIGVS